MGRRIHYQVGEWNRWLAVAAALISTGATIVATAPTAAAPPSAAATPTTDHRADQAREHTPAGPALIEGHVADTLVLVRGGAVCSGTPLTGTRYVATAAHCVLDLEGRPSHRTVLRDGVSLDVTAVWVDTRYVDAPGPRYDAAILELSDEVGGSSASLGAALPTRGSLTIAGYQPLNVDGTLRRPDRPAPRTTTVAGGSVMHIQSRPVGCTIDFDAIDATRTRIDVPCGLVPGASGGGVYAHEDDAIILVGIISTVSHDLTSNGVTPAAALTRLLQRPSQYRYPTAEMPKAPTATTELSIR